MGSTKRENGGVNLTAEEEEEAFAFGIQLTSLSVLPMILKSVIELDVLEIMSRSGEELISAVEIASQLPTQNDGAPVMLDRMLRLLSTYSVLTTKVVDSGSGETRRLYGLGPVCKFLTRNEDGVSLGPLSLMNQDKVLMESWYHLKEAVLEGGVPFNKAYGMTAFDYHGTDPRFNKVFNRGMSDHSTLTLNKILNTYKGFEGLTSLVDVGGGTGATINSIVTKYPHIKGINFDLPHVIEDALPYPGVEHVGGDMFASVPKGDAIFMKWICHDWSDEHCVKFLGNCHKALPDGGKVIVAECVLPEYLDTSLATKAVVHIDVIMLAHNPGGKERTKKDFEALANASGFKRVIFATSAFNTWVMEFLK